MLSERSTGLLVTLIGVLFVVPDSLFVRLIDASAMETAFWRSLSAGCFILVGLLAFGGRSSVASIWNMGLLGWVYCALIGSTSPAFVLAVTQTSVANVVVIFASIPMFAALISYAALGEKISRALVVVMVVVFVGLLIIGLGSYGGEASYIRGDLWALYVSVAYAAALTILRRLKHISMIPAIPIGYIGAALIIGSTINPMASFDSNAIWFVLHGGFIAIATCGLTLGPRYLSSPEVSLLILLETVLAPILVWVVLNEYPGNYTLVGGAIVISALLLYHAHGLRSKNH